MLKQYLPKGFQMINRLLITIFLLLGITVISSAQLNDISFTNKDTIYDPAIATIQLYPRGIPNEMPIIRLGSSSQLILEFDEFRKDINDYYAYIQHCDHNWEPSQLSEFDYISGFSEVNIEDVYFSRTEGPLYNHYQLNFPNAQCIPKVSGNYMLHVYRYDGKEIPAFSRQFYVVENLVGIQADLQFPLREMGQEKQEFDFKVILGENEFYSPIQSIWVDIFQNGRTDNPIKGIKANFTGIRELRFNYLDKISFPALNEFRFIDLRTLRLKTTDVIDIQKTNQNTYEVLMKIDESRQYRPYFLITDQDGYFVIDNQDQFANSEFYAEYVDVWFSYKSRFEMEGKEVHLFGKFMDWQLSERSRMTFDPSVSAYVKKVRLKQGYYDYAYAIVDEGEKVAQLVEAEGGHYETRNFYDFFVYYRSPMGRYDRIIGRKRVSTINYE